MQLQGASTDVLLSGTDLHDQPGLDAACWHVRCALSGTQHSLPRDTQLAGAVHRLSVRWGGYTTIITGAFCALTAFEPPLW